jgi:hypothetical protein
MGGQFFHNCSTWNNCGRLGTCSPFFGSLSTLTGFSASFGVASARERPSGPRVVPQFTLVMPEGSGPRSGPVAKVRTGAAGGMLLGGGHQALAPVARAPLLWYGSNAITVYAASSWLGGVQRDPRRRPWRAAGDAEGVGCTRERLCRWRGRSTFAAVRIRVRINLPGSGVDNVS